jgi:hypothetical protein
LVPAEDNQGLMAASDVLWAKSGTTTLEAAFMERPMVVFYRGDWISYLLFLFFKTVKYVAWPNLLAARMMVPELIQLDCRAAELVRYTRDWLDVPGARTATREELKRIKSYLAKGDFVANAATELIKTLGLKENASAALVASNESSDRSNPASTPKQPGQADEAQDGKHDETLDGQQNAKLAETKDQSLNGTVETRETTVENADRTTSFS